MGFGLVSLSLIILITLVLIYKSLIIGDDKDKLSDEYKFLFETIAGYGLGGSSVALFCRVGGGIYTKAADVGADVARTK